MFGQLDIFQIAQGLAIHASKRQAKIATNIANADTPGFKAQDLKPFSETFRSRRGHEGMKATRPGHNFFAGATHSAGAESIVRSGSAAPNGNSVSLESELVEAVRVRQGHEMALTVYQTSLGILRSSVRGGR